LQSGDNLPEPDEIAALIMTKLQTAMEQMEALTALLEGEEIENEITEDSNTLFPEIQLSSRLTSE